MTTRTCRRIDAVLARHLDGDLDPRQNGEQDPGDGYAFLRTDLLHDHLRTCDACQTALRRARRLDAALARAAGHGLAVHVARGGSSLPELERRWFAAVAATSAPPPPRTARRRAPQPALAIGVLAACLLALSMLRPEPTARPDEPTHEFAVAPVQLPIDALRRRMPAAAALGEQRTTPPLRDLERRLADDDLDLRERVDVARQLLAAATPLGGQRHGALTALLQTLAALGDRSPATRALHGELLDLFRADPHALGALQGRLHMLATEARRLGPRELAFVAVGVRLGTPTLDAALRRLVRRHHDVAPLIASALRGAERPRPAALLLDLWHDLASGGVVPDDDRTATLWFSGQSPTMFADLASELRHSHDGPRRRRCLLALGCAADAAPLPTLLARLDGAHVDEAWHAAFAIGCLPHHVLADLVAAAAEADAHLLRAALVRAGLPAARRWLAPPGSPLQALPGASLASFLAMGGVQREPSSLAD